MPWPGLWNARDLGGLAAAGAVTRSGALIRSDSLHHLTPAGVSAVRAAVVCSAGIARVIDLRSADEATAEPDPELPDGVYRAHPVRGVDDPAHRPDQRHTDQHAEDSLLTTYRMMLDRHSDLFAAAVGAIAEAPPGGVVVHCHAGKDRTGLLIALALTVAGVDDADIAADYGYRGPALIAEGERVVALGMRPADRAFRVDRQSAEPATMGAVLEHLRTAHGGVANYLAAGGLDAAGQDVVRRRLTTDPST